MNMIEPKLTSLLVCDQVITDKDGKHTLIGVFGNINAPKFPAIHFRMVVFCAWVNNGAEGEKVLNIKIIDDEGMPLANSKIENLSINFEKEKTGTFGIFNFNNVLFRKNGDYTIVVELDGNKIGELPIKLSLLSN